MQRKWNWYLDQIVTQGDMDDLMDSIEDAERDMAFEAGLSQADSPDSVIFGGIRDGLVVATTATVTIVSVTAGTCRDDSDTRIELPAAATVQMTKAGDCPEGDYIDAIPTSGADIATSCPGGRRIIASLFLVKDEALSDQVTDGSGATLYHQIDESFHFTIELGSSFDPAAVPVVPSRAALANGKVLLSDVLIENNAGNLQVVACCASSANWDVLGGNYAGYSGRRSDWLAAEIDDANLPYQIEEIRSGQPREFLYSLLQLLQDDAALSSGARGIGAEAITEALVNNGASTVQFLQGTVESQLAQIALGFASVLYRGGNNTLAPESGNNGIVADPAAMQADEVLFGIKALGDAATYNLFRVGKLRGHVALPDMLNEHWTRYMGTDDGFGNTVMTSPFGPWSFALAGPGGTNLYMNRSHPGGALNLTAIQGGGSVELLYGQDDAGNTSIGWHAHQAPYFCASFRFRLSHVASAQCLYQIGMFDLAGGNSRVALFNSGSTIRCYAYDSAGIGVEDILVTTALADTWYTGRIAVVGPRKVIFQVNNGAEVTLNLAADFSGGLHVPRVYIADNDGVTDNILTLGQVQVWNAQLGSDQI